MPSNKDRGIQSPGVNVAVVRKDDDGWKFLVLRRAQNESYAGFWGLLSGTKKAGDTVAMTVVRELKEETGLEATDIWATEYLTQFYEPEFDEIWILPLVVAVVSPDSEVQLSPENDELQWLPAKAARRRVSWKNLVVAIDNVADELEIYPARNWVQITWEDCNRS
jgi:8-oxo-dGTP pyrophosphatase MutT (NUDIX family)